MSAACFWRFERRTVRSFGRMRLHGWTGGGGIFCSLDHQRAACRRGPIVLCNRRVSAPAVWTRRGFMMTRTTAPSKMSGSGMTRRPTSSGSWTCAGGLGVFPHEASNSDVLAMGDLLIVSTSSGSKRGTHARSVPRAPSLIAVDRRSGDVVWRAVGPARTCCTGSGAVLRLRP